jgi:hypothetical protein
VDSTCLPCPDGTTTDGPALPCEPCDGGYSTEGAPCTPWTHTSAADADCTRAWALWTAGTATADSACALRPQRRALAEICAHVGPRGRPVGGGGGAAETGRGAGRAAGGGPGCDFRAYVTSVGRVLAAQLAVRAARGRSRAIRVFP